jgi:hypothetical protein
MYYSALQWPNLQGRLRGIAQRKIVTLMSLHFSLFGWADSPTTLLLLHLAKIQNSATKELFVLLSETFLGFSFPSNGQEKYP